MIEGTFDGCEHGKLYPIRGGGVLECQEYNYFYELSPLVTAIGRDVVSIGNERVTGYLHDGGIVRTQIQGEFTGCDANKSYKLAIGVTFVCNYYYEYDYDNDPKVEIIGIKGRPVKVYIKGKEFYGSLQ